MQQDAPRRKNIRYYHHDYRWPDHYYVTLVVQGRLCLFGDIREGVMHLNAAGQMINKEWLALEDRFPTVKLHNFIVMPNHLHGIIEIQGLADVQESDEVKEKSLGDILKAFKSITTVGYIRGVKEQRWPRFQNKMWQRNYFDRITRDKSSLDKYSSYIEDNPKHWHEDKYNPKKH